MLIPILLCYDIVVPITKKEKVHLVAKQYPAVSKCFCKKEDEFFYNKDTGLFVCPEGHIAIKKAKTRKTYNPQKTHYFDINHCQNSPSKVGCYKERAKSKRYSITLKSDDHLFQKRFKETPYFKEKAKLRYKIEVKNAEPKHRHGLDMARASGLFSMELQVATTIFVVNMKRMTTLINQK